MGVTATIDDVSQSVKDEIDSITTVGTEVQSDPQGWTREGRVD